MSVTLPLTGSVSAPSWRSAQDQARLAQRIGYQSVAILSHLRDKLAEKRELFDEEEMLDLARRHTVFNLRRLCNVARHVADPDGFFNERRRATCRRGLHISQMPDGMYAVDGVLDPVTGASVKTASETLAKRQGPEDERTHSQRMHDAWARS